MATTQRLMTADELLALPDDGQHHELVKGERRTMSPGGMEHGLIGMRIGISWGIHLSGKDLGEVVGSNVGFVLARDPDTVREPDVAFVSRERFEAVGSTAKYWVGAPDLVVEVISPTDRYGDVDEKVAEWLAAGARMVLVVNPRWYTAMVHRPGVPVRILTIEDALDGEDVIPGWRLPLANLFSPRAAR